MTYRAAIHSDHDDRFLRVVDVSADDADSAADLARDQIDTDCEYVEQVELVAA